MESFQELVWAGVAGRGPEDGEICTGWYVSWPADLDPLLDDVDAVIRFWNSMVGLGRGPDRCAPAAKMSSPTTDFRGSQSSLQRWSHIVFGFDGLRQGRKKR
jgi:hypothetical protein